MGCCCCRKITSSKDGTNAQTDKSSDVQKIASKVGKMMEATVLFSIHDGVQIFYVAPNGEVSSPSHPSDIYIVKLPVWKKITFIHVNDWVYPLIPESSSVFKTSYGAYMFPDLVCADCHGYAVGLILSENLPGEAIKQFEHVISSLATLKVEAKKLSTKDVFADRKSVGDTATQIANGITNAADWVAHKIGKVAEDTDEKIKVGSDIIKKNTTPAQQTQVLIDPAVRDGLRQARNATESTVQISEHLINKLSESTNHLLPDAASPIKNQQVVKKYQHNASKLISDADKVAVVAANNLKGTNLEGSANVLKNDVLPHVKTAHDIALKPNQRGKSKLDGVIEVASSGVQGVSTVNASLEAAAKLLAKSLAKETVSIVEHKYGSDMAEMAENSLQLAGNVAATAMNVKRLGTTTTTKEIIKTAGQAVLNTINQSTLNDANTFVRRTSSSKL